MQTNLSTSLPSAWIDRLFSRLALTYGNKFADMWRGQDVESVKQMWANEMAGFTADEIRLALETLRTSNPAWPPTLYEFMDLCRPAPPAINPEVAFCEAMRGLERRKRGEMGDWSHKAIYWAAIDVSAFDVLNLSWPQVKGRWTQAFEKRLADPNLPPIPEPPKQLTAPETPHKQGQERIKAMLAGLTAKMTA